MTAKYTIFSIDGEDDPEVVQSFYEYWETTGAKTGIVELLGSYKDEVENSFMVLTRDFYDHVMETHWVENQESVLTVTECNKMYATLIYLKTGETVGLGCMHQVTPEEAMMSEAWTYSPERDIYWIARKGNPNRRPFEDTEEMIAEIENEEEEPGWLAKYCEVAVAILLIIVFLVYAAPAISQAAPQDRVDEVGYHMLTDQPDHAVMAIYLLNVVAPSVGVDYIHLNTPLGLFVVEHIKTANDECGLPLLCPDMLTLVDWPMGYGPDAMSITVDEFDAGMIRIYEWVGV